MCPGGGQVAVLLLHTGSTGHAMDAAYACPGGGFMCSRASGKCRTRTRWSQTPLRRPGDSHGNRLRAKERLPPEDASPEMGCGSGEGPFDEIARLADGRSQPRASAATCSRLMLWTSG